MPPRLYLYGTGIGHKPSGIEEARVPVDLYDGLKQDCKDEFDLGAIVWELRRMKEERETKEMEIIEGYNAMPDMSILTQSTQHAADEARRAAKEAQRAANEAQRVAEAKHRTLEEAFARKRQVAADELYREKLIRDSSLLRSKLGID